MKFKGLIILFLLALFLGSTPPATFAANPPAQRSCGVGEVETAIGCVSMEFATTGGGNSFLSRVITLSIGLGGGFALLLMLYGTFIVMTSAGVPDKLNQGKDIITSAAAGLVFIILSIFLMNLIGVNLLNIPGLS